MYKAKDDDAEATGTAVVRGFRLVSVFDISQTSGDELPNVGITRLTGTVEGYDALRETLIAHYGVNVHYELPDNIGEANGWCKPDNAEIAIRSGLDQAQEVKTLIHELAHYLLHGGENADLPQDTMELQAESVAYIVCQHIGLDTQEYSFGYVASWAQDKQGSEIMDALKPVAKTAASIMEVLDGLGNDMAA